MLFLDELTEFRRDAVEGLRQPLEDGRIVVARAQGAVEFPARFTLVAASNPCPCGFADDPRRMCRCQPTRAQAYAQRLSGPLLDRVDIRLSVPRLTKAELMDTASGEPSAIVRERVEVARERQRDRLVGTPWWSNAQMPGTAVRRMAQLDEDASRSLSGAVERFSLSGRGFDRAIRVARTIADLEGSVHVRLAHMAEALSLRAVPSAEEMAPVG